MSNSRATQSPLRWGILGTAQIARKNWKAIARSGNSIVAAVASRDIARSRAFISDCQADTPFPAAPTALGAYGELVALPDIDAIYCPLPTAARREWILRAAAAGKHIVCEKPCAVSLAELREMFDACRHHRVQFMDGVMFMHSRRLDRVRTALDDTAGIGRIRRISSAFSFCGDDAFFAGNIRSRNRLEPDGCLGDLGWYCLRFALWVMKEQLPRRVTGRFLEGRPPSDPRGEVPTEFSGELFFDDGVTSDYYCSFVTADQQWAQVAGSDGWLRIPDFVLPFFGPELGFEVNNANFEVKGCEFRMHPGHRRFSVPESSNGGPDSQEANLFRNFANQVRSGALNEAWPAMALNTQRVMEACLQSARQGSQPVDIAP